MQIALVHNPGAGGGEVERDDIRRLLEAEGHRVAEFGKDDRDVEQAIATAPDVLVIAGGDGTVARAIAAAFATAGAVPIFILPIGTANNIARSVGVDRPVPELIRGLSSAGSTRLDVGRVTAPWGTELFVEGAGVGFIGGMLRNPMSTPKRLVSAVRGAVTRTDLPTRKTRGVAQLIRDQPVMSLRITADGAKLDGYYIAVEAMNIREIGPNIGLTPRADWSDGLLDLALVRSADREELAAAIEAGATGSGAITVRRVRTVELSWPPDFGHVDDTAWPDESAAAGAVRVTVAGSVALLRPA